MEGVIYHMWSLKALRDKFLGFCYSPIRSVCILTRASWCTCIRTLCKSVYVPGLDMKKEATPYVMKRSLAEMEQHLRLLEIWLLFSLWALLRLNHWQIVKRG